MARIVWSAVLAGTTAFLLHFQPWNYLLTTRECCRAEPVAPAGPKSAGDAATPPPLKPQQKPNGASSKECEPFGPDMKDDAAEWTLVSAMVSEDDTQPPAGPAVDVVPLPPPLPPQAPGLAWPPMPVPPVPPQPAAAALLTPPVPRMADVPPAPPVPNDDAPPPPPAGPPVSPSKRTGNEPGPQPPSLPAATQDRLLPTNPASPAPMAPQQPIPPVQPLVAVPAQTPPPAAPDAATAPLAPRSAEPPTPNLRQVPPSPLPPPAPAARQGGAGTLPAATPSATSGIVLSQGIAVPVLGAPPPQAPMGDLRTSPAGPPSNPIDNVPPPSPATPPPGPCPLPGPAIPPAPTAPVPLAKPFTSPWTFHLEIIDGKNVVTARVGKTVQFRFVCDKVDIQSPAGHIQASGGVKITSQALSASCDRVTIHLQDEAVMLEGSAQMKCRQEGQELELHSDRFSLKLSELKGTANRPAPGRTSEDASRMGDPGPNSGAMRPNPTGSLPDLYNQFHGSIPANQIDAGRTVSSNDRGAPIRPPVVTATPCPAPSSPQP